MKKTVTPASQQPLPAKAKARQFSKSVLTWFERHGRTHLPWQQNPTSYRVWVSEIMLQQTQVATVIPYFEKFMGRFPTIETLAAASQDQVLQHWSGLGYYARGRNLHKTAQVVVSQLGGDFPETVDGLVALPGIGRSTAGAILSLACGQSTSILDGNVKRVLCRHFTIDGWYGQSSVEKQLWQLTDSLTPDKRTGEYNQAMMDLGATLCTRSSPSCNRCPVQKTCGAAATGNPIAWPHKKPKKDKPQRETVMLILQSPDGTVLMQRRPPSGIWGGLWGFPEFRTAAQATASAKQIGSPSGEAEQWSPIRHTFTHFDLQITPVYIRLKKTAIMQVHETDLVWHHPGDELGGFAAPVSTLLNHLTGSRKLGL